MLCGGVAGRDDDRRHDEHLRARIQEANIAIDRGNLPYAETLLDDTILQAKGRGFKEIRAMATHDRARVANRRGKFDEAVVLQYEAFKGVRNQMARDRVLNDLGASFVQLGVYSAARDAYLVVPRRRRSSICAGRQRSICSMSQFMNDESRCSSSIDESWTVFRCRPRLRRIISCSWLKAIAPSTNRGWRRRPLPEPRKSPPLINWDRH